LRAAAGTMGVLLEMLTEKYELHTHPGATGEAAEVNEHEVGEVRMEECFVGRVLPHAHYQTL